MAKFWPMHRAVKCMGEKGRKTLGTILYSSWERGRVDPIRKSSLCSRHDFLSPHLCNIIHIVFQLASGAEVVAGSYVR